MNIKLVPFLANTESIFLLVKLPLLLTKLTRLLLDFQEVALLNLKSSVEEEVKVLSRMDSKVVFISLKMLQVPKILLERCSDKD
jgi:hypothetical protein